MTDYEKEMVKLVGQIAQSLQILEMCVHADGYFVTCNRGTELDEVADAIQNVSTSIDNLFKK